MSDKLSKQLEKGLEKLQDRQDDLFAKQAEEIENIGEAHKETNEAIAKNNEMIEEQKEQLHERMDELEKVQNRAGGLSNKGESFESQIKSAIDDNADEISQMKNRRGRSVSVETKATMTTDSAYTGEVIASDRLPGVNYDPDRPSHVRQFIPQVSTNSNSIRYIRETSYNDGTGAQSSEGASKGESDFKLQAYDAPVQTIATTLRLSKQMLDDSSFITSYINQRAPKKLLVEEDNEVLYGSGSNGELTGITGEAQAYSSVLDASDIQYESDVLIDAAAQSRNETNGEYVADTALIHPTDYYNIVISKTTDGEYIMPEMVRQGIMPMSVAGMRVSANTAINQGNFLVGDYSMGAIMAMREGVNLEFFYEDRDNVPKNLVTVRIEERLALPILNSNAFIYGAFDSVQGS